MRRDLRWLGFGQLTPALFAHPACTLQQARRWLRNVAGAREALLLHSASADVRIDRKLAARGWDLAEQARRYRRFIARFAPVAEASANGGVTAETAFLIRTLLIHEYPQDPPAGSAAAGGAAAASDWAGTAAYGLCRALYARVFAAAESYLSGTARRLHRSLPPADAAAHARFGGIARYAATQPTHAAAPAPESPTVTRLRPSAVRR